MRQFVQLLRGNFPGLAKGTHLMDKHRSEQAQPEIAKREQRFGFRDVFQIGYFGGCQLINGNRCGFTLEKKGDRKLPNACHHIIF